MDLPGRPGAEAERALGRSLVLVDAGAELNGYCSDVSRTWPVGGAFTPAQRAVYELVHSRGGADARRAR